MNLALYLSIALNVVLIVSFFSLDGRHGTRYGSLIGMARRFLQAPANAPYEVYKAIAEAPKHEHHAMIPRKREEIGMLLEAIGGFKIGVELGVQSGGFAGIMLNTWKSCDKYYLVDLWSQQNNYHDWANVDNATQEKVMNDAKNNLKQWESKTVFIRNYTSAALPFVPGLVDFVYVDARHDYCGAWEDMTLWWPKLRTGGIMAGHDYLHAAEVQGQD